MAIALFAGIDQGTSGTRASLHDEHGRCVATAYRRSRTHHPRRGWDEQDGAELVRAVEETLAEAIAQVPGAEVRAMGLANQGESVIAFDRRTGAPLSPAILWSDRRGAAVLADLDPEDGAEVQARTGLPLDPYFSSSKIAWMLRSLPEVRAAAEAGRLAIGTLDAFLVFQLTEGAAFITDPSTGSRTQLMDLDTLRFDAACAAAFAIPPEVLPEMGPTVLPEPIPTRTGVPLCATSCDQQAALAAIGAIRPGDVKVTYGTGCFIEAHAGAAARRPGHGLMATVAWDVPGEATAWAIEGGVFTASTAVEWLVSLGLAPDGPGVTALATRAGDDLPLFLPSFSGVGAPWWRPGAAGVLSGLRASTTPADIARAVLTGIAQRVADVLDAVDAEQGLATAIRVDGGLSASEVLLQLQADLAGRPVLPSAERETTAAGVAALAAIGCGALTLEDLGARARFAAPVEPRLAPAAREAARERWRAFVEATAALDPA